MRFFFGTLFALVISAGGATAKDWGQMNGHERRAHVASYVIQNHLRCPTPSSSPAEQEAILANMPWILVTIGLKRYCVPGSAEQDLAKRKADLAPVLTVRPEHLTSVPLQDPVELRQPAVERTQSPEPVIVREFSGQKIRASSGDIHIDYDRQFTGPLREKEKNLASTLRGTHTRYYFDLRR